MTDRPYVRISLDTAVSGSITKQRASLAKRTSGEPEWYVDESVSGSKIPFAERPEGRRLLADLQPGDRVLVTKIDRAARNVRDLLGLVAHVEKAGASIHFVDQNIDTAGPMGRFMLTLLAAVAELEADIIAERRRESLAAFAVEGRHAVGRAPFGLRSVPNPDGRGLVLRPDPDTAPVLRDVVDRLFAGESQTGLAKVAGMGGPAFGRLLRNGRLAGILDTSADGVRLDPDMAVFTLPEWARLQEFITRPVKTWAKAEGIGAALSCGVCGDRLYLNAARNPAHSTYRCRKVKHADGEPGVTVIAANADALVAEEFLAMYGRLAVREFVEVGNSDERDAAIALARLHLDAVRQAQDAAEGDDEEELMFAAYRAAKKALRDAEALPTGTTTEVRETGQTFREVWQASTWDARAVMLLRVGPWIVEPGRLPLTEKVYLADREPDYLAGQTDLQAAGTPGEAAAG